MIIIDNKYSLLIIIKRLRAEMIRIGISEGLTNEKTIRISQKLDRYISRYQKLKSAK